MCNYRYLEFACSCTGEVWTQPCPALKRPPMCRVDTYWFPTQTLHGVCPGCSKKPDNRTEKSLGCVMVASGGGGGGGGNVEDGVEDDVVSGELNCLASTQVVSKSSSSAGIGSDVDDEWELENVVPGGLHYQGVDNGGIETEVDSGGGGELRPGDTALGGQHYLVTGTRDPSAGTDPDVDGEWEPDEMTPGGQRYSADTQAASSSEVEVDTVMKDNIEATTGPDAGEELELDDMIPVDTRATRSNEIEVDIATEDNIAGEEPEPDDMTPGEQYHLVVAKDNIEAATHPDADGEWGSDNITPSEQYCLAIGTQATGDNSLSAGLYSDIDGDSDIDGEWEPDDMTPGGQHYLTDTQAACSNEIEADVVKEDSIEVATDHPDTNGELEPDDMSPGGHHFILDAQTGSDWIEADVVTNDNIETSADSDVDGEWEPDDMTPGGQHYILDFQTTSNNETEVDATNDNIETSADSDVDGEWETDDMTPGGQHYLIAITQTTDSNVSSPLNLLEDRTNGDYGSASTAPLNLVKGRDMQNSHTNSSGQKQQAISNDSGLQKKLRRTAGVSCWVTKNKKQKHNHSPPWRNIYADIPTSFTGKCGERRSGRIGWDNIQ
ncbi:hypothetical protein Q9L58_000976 [Maublancomyces gigas]|uniref:Uncharacterized protein n=1 Tax=Discina gigas TaxID=1032678 RepID=A0ABR3GVE9_9PEZI